MAEDLRISELPTLAGENLAGGDYIPVSDLSASETKKITVSDLIGNATALLSDDTIPGSKILFSSQDVDGAALANGTVDSLQIKSNAVSADKLANNSSVNVAEALPEEGVYTGQLGVETGTFKASLWDGSEWKAFKAAGSINEVSITSGNALSCSVTTTNDAVAITAGAADTTAAAQFLAGPTDGAGSVSARSIAGTDLPTATAEAKGAVSVNGNGLSIDDLTAVLSINNSVTSSATHHLVTYNEYGLVTGGRLVSGDDMPIATTTTRGGVIVGNGLSVSESGTLNHSNTVTAGSAAKVNFDAEGHITEALSLAAADIPNIPASKINSGTLDATLFPNNGIAGKNLADYSVTQFGGPESTSGVTIFPTAQYRGQFFYEEARGDLYIWSGSAWLAVTITAGELVFAGIYDASTNTIASLTAAGQALSSFAVGSALPAADAANNQHYFVVEDAGTGTGYAPNVALNAPDQIVSDGGSWVLLDVSNTISGAVASSVTFTASGNISASNVQSAIQELDNEKLAKNGGTITGDVIIGSGGNITVGAGNLRFEGSTADDYETVLTAVDPTLDRTITFPDTTGTVVTTGDTETVTNGMLAGSIAYSKLSLSNNIVNADISTSAAIAYSKLNLGTSIVNADISTSASIAYSKLNLGTSIVNGDISASAAIADSKLAQITTAGKVSGAAITSGTIGGSTSLSISGSIATSSSISDSAGNVRRIPQNAQTAAYTLAATDVGKHISITSGGVTVPANVFAVGDNVSIFNNSTSNQGIVQGSGVTLRAGGTLSTGGRTLVNYGVATILCVAPNTFVITGVGIL